MQPSPGTGFQQMPIRIREPNMYSQNSSIQQVIPQSAADGANMQSLLTRAGVSNFAQQMRQLGQQLQYLMERLHFAQNQVQTQAEAQLRELQQIQQAIALTMQQVQQMPQMPQMQQMPQVLQQAQMPGSIQPNLMQ